MDKQKNQDRRAADNDVKKGVVESQTPTQKDQVSLQGQLPHRDQDPNIKGKDTDFPEPGENPEYSGERQEPGFSQKTNQNDKKDDPLAA